VKPLRVALVHYDTPRMLGDRSVGIWSYPVPEFEVTHFPQSKHPVVDATSWVDDFDVIVQEDNRCWPEYVNPGKIPMFYYVVDSTLSDEHLYNRQRHASKFDVVMVDLDELELFEAPGRPVWRVSHCVNDRMFVKTGAKTVDVGFHCFRKGPGGKKRQVVARAIEDFCRQHEYTFDTSCPGGARYAAALARERVTIQCNRNPRTRAHRTFDAMACWTALLTETLPHVSYEFSIQNYHYAAWDTLDEMRLWIAYLLGENRWMQFAERGRLLVTRHHTWSFRASTLHERMTRYLERRHGETHSA